MKVCMYVDPISTMTDEDEAIRLGLESGADYEYQGLEEMLRGIFPGNAIIFERNVLFKQLENAVCDFYIFDIGGMCAHDYSGIQRSNWCHTIVRMMQDMPSTGFVPYSRMTRDSVRLALEDMVLGDSNEVPDNYKTPEFPNLFMVPKALEFDIEADESLATWMRKFYGVSATHLEGGTK